MPVIYTDKVLPERKEKDFYETPYMFCLATLDKFNRKESPFLEFILDPGAGTGVWGLAFCGAFDNLYGEGMFHPELVGVELREVEPNPEYDSWYTMDFLSDYQGDSIWDLIMGNPPYNLAEAFIERSLGLLGDDGYLLFLLPLSFLETKRRYVKYYNSGLNPKYVWVSSNRINFVNAGSQNPNSYAVFIWQKGWKGKTELDWINWR